MKRRMSVEDHGVSSVVAAVLLVALFTTMFLTYTVTTLPEWISDNERAHQKLVKERMDTLKGGLEALSASNSPGAVSAAVPLASSKVPLLQQNPATGELSYVDGFRAQLGFASSPSTYMVGGQLVANPTATDAALTPDAETLAALVIAITSADVNGNDDFASYQVAVTDSSSTPQTFTATLSHAQRNVSPNLGCSDGHVRLAIDVGLGASYTLLACGLDNDIPTAFTVDLMARNFGAAVKGMEPPLSISFSSSTSSATVAGTHAAVWQDATGTDHFAGTPRVGPFSIDQDGGYLKFLPHNQEFTNQETTWEGGAIVITQSDGAVVATDPSFMIDGSTSTGVLHWTLTELTGSGSLGGDTQATATATHSSTSDVLLVSSSGTFTITSPNAAAWRSFFSDRILAGGATGSATSGGSGDTATLTLGGGTVTSWVLRLHVVEATVTVS